jgi:redox-sensitive bicupin YhaK (pirin superfamily)
MTVHLSPTVAAQQRGRDGSFSVRALDLAGLGPVHSPVVVFDEFRVHGRPFPPHPHAGFAAVTYVFADSEGGLRSRDSLGHDYVAGPGGLVWTQAGRGVIHHEVPAEPHPLHGLQLFVNTRASNKLNPPKTLRLAGDLVPEWRSEGGDRVRVVVGSFGDLVSPLVTDEPFTLLDVALHRELAFDLPSDHVAIAYVVQGRLAIESDGNERQLSESQAIALHGTGGRVSFGTRAPTQFLIVSGPVLDEPIVIDGPFIMNDSAQIEAAIARYRAGEMGMLGPL